MIMGKPVICVSSDSNNREKKGAEPRQHYSPAAYSRAIAAAGGVPVIAPEQCCGEMAELCDALLLTGGDDVCPELYGEEILNDTVCTDPKRTAYEVPLTRAFLEKEKPILCICRGFQIMNCVLGGDLYQDLVAQCGYVHMNTDIRHFVTAEPGSVLYKLFGERFKVNSTHHQAVRRLGEGLHVTARSVDGLIEAFEHDTLPIWGTQFHPERLTGIAWDDRTDDFAPYFAAFIDLVREHQKG